jgi:hypothetical protein
LARKWNRILVEEDHGVVEVHEGGRMMPGLNVAMCHEDVEATRHGAKCINCFENFDSETPGGIWPDNCFVCGYPVKTHQAEQFARVYAGYDPMLRTGADWEAEADRIEEARERRAFARRAKESGSGISIAGASVGAALKRMKGGR